MTFCYLLEPQANCAECLWPALTTKERIKTSFSELKWTTFSEANDLKKVTASTFAVLSQSSLNIKETLKLVITRKVRLAHK